MIKSRINPVSVLLFSFLNVYSLAVLSGQAEERAKFESWWTENSKEYIAHGIAPDNVDVVLSSGFLKPGELVLRETGRISYEKADMGRDRSEDVVSRAVVEDFARAHPLPPVCEGIEYVRIHKVEEGNEIQIKKPGNSDWEVLRKYPGPIVYRYSDEKPYHKKVTDADAKLFKLMTDDDGALVELEFPVPYCPRFDQDLNRRMEVNTTLFTSYLFVEEKGGDESSLRQSPLFAASKSVYEAFAKSKEIDLNALAVMVDEINGRTADKNLAKVRDDYDAALAQFKKTYLERFPKRQEILDEFAWIGPEGRARNWFRGARMSQYFAPSSNKLQTGISFLYNGVAPYGNTVVLVGSDELSKLIPLEDSSIGLKQAREAFNWSPPRSNEVQTSFSLESGFVTVNLHDPNILIVGPKAELEKLKEKFPNMIFKEDLSEDQLKKMKGARSLYDPHK